MSQAAGIFEVFTAHCVFCEHVERALTPEATHEAMEGHYGSAHPLKIQRIVSRL